MEVLSSSCFIPDKLRFKNPFLSSDFFKKSLDKNGFLNLSLSGMKHERISCFSL